MNYTDEIYRYIFSDKELEKAQPSLIKSLMIGVNSGKDEGKKKDSLAYVLELLKLSQEKAKIDAMILTKDEESKSFNFTD